MIHSFFAISFAPYAGIVFLLIFLFANTAIDKRVRNLFFLLAVLEFTELTLNNLELWTSTFAQPGTARMLLSALGYSVRIINIYLFLLLSLRNHSTAKSRALWAIPACINVILSFSVFFTDIVYSFSADNHFQRGPLGYASHIIFLFYLVCILFATIKEFRSRQPLEFAVIFAIVIFIASSIMISSLFAVDGLSCTATVLSMVFYYMFFQTQVYRETMCAEQQSRKLFEKKSKTDGMTGLLNKNAFGETTSAALCGHIEGGLALVFLDLDHFKSINDSLGHLTGDKVIKDAAKKLQNIFRNADIIGRFGGDEFCIFLPGISQNALCQRLDEVLLALQAEYANETNKIKITASIGAVYCEVGKKPDLQSLLALADKATYEAKSSGRNRYIVHEL